MTNTGVMTDKEHIVVGMVVFIVVDDLTLIDLTLSQRLSIPQMSIEQS